MESLSLEETVIHQRAAALQREALRLARQRAFLREERRQARQEEAEIADEKARLEHVARPDFWPEAHLRGAGDPAGRLRLRIGGQDFEVSKSVLCHDDKSLLHALCQPSCPLVAPGDSGLSDIVVIDRDWWLFRFVLIFLRDGVIPEDRATALELYREAAFYRLVSLQRAIEEAHLNLTRLDIRVEDGKLKETSAKEEDKFWKQKKNWWEAPQPPKEKKVEKKPDFWNDPFVLEKDDKKKDKDFDSTTFLRSTWTYQRR